MATQVKIKRRTADATAPTGLTAGEMAINLVDKKLYVGGTGGTNVIFLDSTSAVGLGTANTFTALNSFNAGISASGGTFTSDIHIVNTTTYTELTVGFGGGGVYSNMAFGREALFNNTIGGGNAAIGFGALAANTEGSGNIALGNTTLVYNTTGSNNIAIGSGVLYWPTESSDNIAIGNAAMQGSPSCSPGLYNIGIGTNALKGSGFTGDSNVAIGYDAITNATTGSHNVALGFESLRNNSTGLYNTSVGSGALRLGASISPASVSQMTALGYKAGRYRGTGTTSLLTGTGGIYIGYQARGSTADQTNEIVIGVNALGLGSNTAVIGATLQSAATIYGLLNLPSGLSASGATFTGNISASNIVNSFNGLTGAVTGVSSFNGLTGAVSGVTTSVANTFMALNTFSAGISASGATFSGNIKIPVNGTGAVTIGNHATRNLTLGSSGGVGEIVQTGSRTATVNIRQENGGMVSIGDYAAAGNSTYISVEDFSTAVNVGGQFVQVDCDNFTVNAATASTFTGTVTVPTPINATDAANKTYVDSTGVQTFNGLTGTATGVGTAIAGTGISVSGATGAVTITNIGVQTFNGLTGTATGVGTAIAGTGISVSGATGAVTITNIGVQTFNGLTGAVTGITAGGVNTFTALNTFSAGISASGATFNGTVNIGTTALISAPSATALAIKSAVPAGTGVTPTIQIICPSAAYLLTNQTATQKVFDLPQDTITLQAATTYMFEGQYLLTTGTTTHITSMSFVLTTATMTNCSWTSNTGMPTALNAATSGAFQAIFNSVAGGAVNTTSTSANTMITFKGIMRVNVGGTMVPNISFSAQPGGTNNVLIGSYLKFYPIGANTIDFVGTAIG